jgi:hypothetical protein
MAEHQLNSQAYTEGALAQLPEAERTEILSCVQAIALYLASVDAVTRREKMSELLNVVEEAIVQPLAPPPPAEGAPASPPAVVEVSSGDNTQELSGDSDVELASD